MKTKWLRISGIALLFSALLFTACNKAPAPTENTVTSMNDLVVSDNFSWATTKSVAVDITTPSWDPSQVVKIYSIDGKTLYYAGFPASNGVVSAQITVPTASNMLLVEYGSGSKYRSTLVGINDQLSYNYNSFKSAAVVSCDLSGEISFSQGGWSSKAHGDNPGSIRDAHFDELFPNGLVMGDPDHYTITLTSSSAVKNFLPGGSTSKVLTNSYTNISSKTNKNVSGNWGGQIVAAILNVAYSKAGYLGTGPNLGDLVFTNGAFQGMTVNDFMVIANKAIGGGGLSGYSIEDIQNAAELVDINFDSGTTNEGYFTCASTSSTCGCNDGLRTMTLKYNGTNAANIVAKGTSSNTTYYSGTVQPGATFTINGTGTDGKLDQNVAFTVDGNNNTTINVSCVVNIYKGDVYGDFTITDGVSKDGLHLCEKSTTPDCGCEDGLYSMSLKYNGTSSAYIKVKETGSNCNTQIYSGSVQPDGTFSFNGSSQDGKLRGPIEIYVNNSLNATIQTVCSADPKAGDVYGDFTLVAATSQGNIALCNGGGGGTTPPPGGGTTTSVYAGTLAYEDLWPYKGDYDFNDIVEGYNFAITKDDQDQVQNISATFILYAFGASYHNGFGFQLPGVNPDQIISVTGYNLASDTYINLASNGLEQGQSKATVIVFDDAWRLMTYPGMGIGVNTNMSAPYVTPDTIVIQMKFYDNGSFASGGPVTYSQLNIGNFNPFIIVNKVRGVEVHLPDHAPTDLADMSLLGTGDDASNPATGTYYKTDKNLPWAINLPIVFQYPIEKQDITGAYLFFADWAQSSGVLYPDWYLPNPGYTNSSLIYVPH
ncbi:MAG: LruC domain-containing protein [Bacteroidales bacterium]|nr:LruC domain-containing protein [Bacteroidales bacterium]